MAPSPTADSLIKVAVPHRLTLRVITLGVGHREALQEARKVAVGPRIEHPVPVIRHQAVSQNAHGHPIHALLHDFQESAIMSGIPEQAGTKVRAVQHVVNHASNIHPPNSAHNGILPRPPSRKKAPDSFLLAPFFLFREEEIEEIRDAIHRGARHMVRRNGCQKPLRSLGSKHHAEPRAPPKTLLTPFFVPL